jgi:hypothetical protein
MRTASIAAAASPGLRRREAKSCRAAARPIARPRNAGARYHERTAPRTTVANPTIRIEPANSGHSRRTTSCRVGHASALARPARTTTATTVSTRSITLDGPPPAPTRLVRACRRAAPVTATCPWNPPPASETIQVAWRALAVPESGAGVPVHAQQASIHGAMTRAAPAAAARRWPAGRHRPDALRSRTRPPSMTWSRRTSRPIPTIHPSSRAPRRPSGARCQVRSVASQATSAREPSVPSRVMSWIRGCRTTTAAVIHAAAGEAGATRRTRHHARYPAPRVRAVARPRTARSMAPGSDPQIPATGVSSIRNAGWTPLVGWWPSTLGRPSRTRWCAMAV